MEYVRPEIVDHGDLRELTLGCLGTGPPDAALPVNPDAFPDASPAFGDPSFCE